MSGKLESRSALVLALIAVSIALGGNAVATVTHSGGHKIKRGEIAQGAVTAKALAKGAVTASKLRKESVTSRKIQPGAVGADQIANSAVTARAIAPTSIYGYALGPVESVSAVIKDQDADCGPQHVDELKRGSGELPRRGSPALGWCDVQ